MECSDDLVDFENMLSRRPGSFALSLRRESDEERREALEIPYRELSDSALRGVLEAFVLREGTDYGETHHALEDKVQQVMRQLERHEARIVFDPNSESVDIIVTAPLRRRPADD